MPIFFFLILFFSSPCWGCNYIDDPYPGSCGNWQNTEACFGDESSAQSWCLSHQLPRIGCTKLAISSTTDWGGVDVPVGTVYFVTYDNGCPSRFNISWVLPSLDTDGDGIPDDQDPCPNNPNPNCDPNDDSDGDGKKDDEDPCPNNPNPNCTDPNDPPGPTIPGEIVIGDCTVDITSLKAWLLSDDSFPFNFIWRIYTVISPLLDLSPEPPVLEFDFSLDPSSKYSWVPDRVPLKFDFTQFDFLAKLLRYFEIAGLCLAFAFYGMKRYRNFTGAGG